MIEVQTICTGVIKYTSYNSYGDAIDFINKLLYIDKENIDAIFIINKNDITTYYVSDNYIKEHKT